KKIQSNNELYSDSYKKVAEAVANSTAQYKGKPVEFLYQPMFLTETDYQRFDSLTAELYKILNKVIQHYIMDADFRKHFGFSPLLEELILKDPGYSTDVPIGRFDIFYHYDTGSFQFCELNADGSSGMVEQQEIARVFRNSAAIREYEGEYSIRDFELFDSWVKILQRKYKEFSKRSEKPQVAIVDWLQADPPSEFVEFQKAFEKDGCKTIIVDPRWLEYREGKLYYKDFRIDCIYRRAVTWEIIEGAEAVRPFIEAYLAGDVCVVGPLRSQIIHNKIIFALLHDEVKTPFLTEADREFIKSHIPYTAIFDISDDHQVNYAIANKDLLVLKPMDKYASKGVRIGEDYSTEEWIKIIDEEAKEEYLLQEFCRVPKVKMAFFNEEHQVEFKESNYIIGLFMYDGRLQGVYTRTGTKNIIGSIVECYTVPNFVFSPKYT
ncbi:MAG: glutathionylspermidine synthase family protein, partial [Flavobacteriales bacterium]|nr:glutathionylspermidine synthase family protein [Flavobacteriales bacterium]